MTDHFLHCRDCAEVVRPSACDRAPQYHVTAAGEVQTARDDCMSFLVRHARHRLQTLRLVDDLRASSGPLWDPLATRYWQVSNGTETLLVRGSRTRLTDPVRYEIFGGRLVAEPPSVEVPEADLRAEVDRALFPGVASARRLDAFVAAFRAVVAALDPVRLEILYDVPSDPTLSVAGLPHEGVDELLRRLRDVFDDTERGRIEAHLRAGLEEGEGFTVLLRQRVRVEAPAAA